MIQNIHLQSFLENFVFLVKSL